MLELRMEATRRPELHSVLSGFLTAELQANVGFHVEAGLPGDRIGVDLDVLVDAMVKRLL